MNFILNIIWNDVIAKNFKFVLQKVSMIIKDISTYIPWYKSHGHSKYQGDK